MNFAEELQRLAAANPGTLCISLMGYDGISIAEYRKDNLDVSVEENIIQSIDLLKKSSQVFEANQLGDIEELSAKTNKYCFVFKPLTKEHFLYVMLERQATLGKMKFSIDKKTLEFSQALL